MRFAVSKIARLIPLALLALAPEAFACYDVEPTVLVPTDPGRFDAPDKLKCICPPTTGCTESTPGSVGFDSTLSAYTARTVYFTTNEAPGPAKLYCENLGNQNWCEAFPQPENAGDFTYKWYASGKATKPTLPDPNVPAYTFGCAGAGAGAVWAEVKHGNQTVSTIQYSVYCTGN